MQVKKIIDLTQPIYKDSPGYPGYPFPKISMITSIEKGDVTNSELVELASHSGTHLDAPYHFIQGGRKVTDLLPQELTGKAEIIDLTPLKENEEITIEHLTLHEYRIRKCDIPLIYTGWCRFRRQDDRWVHRSPWLGLNAAKWLTGMNIKGVGVDHFSIGTTDGAKDTPTHTCLLENSVWILEDLMMTDELIEGRDWFLVVAPLKLNEASGSQARVYAMKFGFS